MTINRGVRQPRLSMSVLVLVLAFSTTACATLLAKPYGKDACMESGEFARLYTDFWIGSGGGSTPGQVLTGLFSGIFYAPVAALSYSVEHQICHSAKGQPEQGQIYNFFKWPPEHGQRAPEGRLEADADEGGITREAGLLWLRSYPLCESSHGMSDSAHP
jgi:hypothetical protein